MGSPSPRLVSYSPRARIFSRFTMNIILTTRSASLRLVQSRPRFVVVVYTEREDDVIRIVGAKKATKKEVELFQQHKVSNQ